MKRRIEHSHVRCSGKEFPHFANTRDDYWIMQRGQRIELFHLCEELISDYCGFDEFLAAVNNSMSDDSHFTRIADDSSVLRSKFRNHRLEGGCVISFFQVPLHLAPAHAGPAMF